MGIILRVKLQPQKTQQARLLYFLLIIKNLPPEPFGIPKNSARVSFPTHGHNWTRTSDPHDVNVVL